MKDWFKIIVFVLERMLHNDKPLFGSPKEIDIFVGDGIRRCEIVWDPVNGARFFDGHEYKGV